MFQVFITYVYVEALVNWICIKAYDSIIYSTRNVPDPVRHNRLMEQIEEGNPRNGLNLDATKVLRYNGKHLENEDAKRYEKELQVLSLKWCQLCKVCF